jgi:hypothetical protein
MKAEEVHSSRDLVTFMADKIYKDYSSQNMALFKPWVAYNDGREIVISVAQGNSIGTIYRTNGERVEIISENEDGSKTAIGSFACGFKTLTKIVEFADKKALRICDENYEENRSREMDGSGDFPCSSGLSDSERWDYDLE